MVRQNIEEFTTTVKADSETEQKFQPVVEEFDQNGNIINDGEHTDVYARRVLLGDGVTYHIPMDVENSLLQIDAGETMQDRDRKRNTPKFQLKQVSPTAFDRYMEYLESHQTVKYRNAQREV